MDNADDFSDYANSEGENRSTSMKWLWALFGAVVVAGAGYALLSGGGETSWSNDVASEPEAPVQKEVAVPAEPPASGDKANEVRGIVQAAEEATIASRMTARIIAMPYRVGAAFRKGAVLVQLDCSQIRAELAAANAATAAYRKTYETNVELDSYEAIGTNEVAVSKANLNKAQAEGAAVQAQLRDCRVIAPFGGTVVEEIAHRGEVAASGQPLMKLQSGGALEAELIVPSGWLKWLKPGAEFNFLIDETGAQTQGVVKRLGASVDPVSKTIRVTGDLNTGSGLVLPGMSGTAAFTPPETKRAPDSQNQGQGSAETSGAKPQTKPSVK